MKKALRDLITPKIQMVARERFENGGNLAIAGLPKLEVKIALLLVLDLNPFEVLSAGEAAVVYGLTGPTLRKRQPPGELPKKFNLGK
jgi:hypothetical protein